MKEIHQPEGFEVAIHLCHRREHETEWVSSPCGGVDGREGAAMAVEDEKKIANKKAVGHVPAKQEQLHLKCMAKAWSRSTL